MPKPKTPEPAPKSKNDPRSRAQIVVDELKRCRHGQMGEVAALLMAQSRGLAFDLCDQLVIATTGATTPGPQPTADGE